MFWLISLKRIMYVCIMPVYFTCLEFNRARVFVSVCAWVYVCVIVMCSAGWASSQLLLGCFHCHHMQMPFAHLLMCSGARKGGLLSCPYCTGMKSPAPMCKPGLWYTSIAAAQEADRRILGTIGQPASLNPRAPDRLNVCFKNKLDRVKEDTWHWPLVSTCAHTDA